MPVPFAPEPEKSTVPAASVIATVPFEPPPGVIEILHAVVETLHAKSTAFAFADVRTLSFTIRLPDGIAKT